jgi:hypothetical protein
MYRYWINGKALIQFHGCVILCVLLILCSWMFASCHTFAFICCVCDFMVEVKSERENEYRHPHCIILTLAFRSKKRRACRELYEEHSMCRHWINRRSWFKSMVLVSFLYALMLNDVLMSFCFPVMQLFYCCVCDFMVEFKIWGKKKWVSIVSLSEWGFLQGVQSKMSTRSALTETRVV